MVDVERLVRDALDIAMVREMNRTVLDLITAAGRGELVVGEKRRLTYSDLYTLLTEQGGYGVR